MAGVGLRSERGPVLVAIMLSTGLVALDSTIIATAVPSVVRDLGGFSQFPWLFSVYLLTQAVTVPLYGKFADSLGRRPVLFFGIGVFLLGSVLCGAAWSMPALIVARAVQGIGAGAVQPISMTVVGDLYTLEERARVQGYVASVWGIASVLGPTLGGLFAEYLSWRLIFFINLPLGAIAVWMLVRHFAESVERREHRVDYAGAVTLTGGFSLLILGLLEGGVAWPWLSVQTLVVFALGLVLLGAFPVVERRAGEPVLPLWVFGRRVLAGSSLIAFVVGALLIGLSSFLPTYAQGVLGTGPVVAGFALAALTVGWPLAASVAGRIYLRIGFRDTALIGIVFVIAGAVLTATLLREGTSVWVAAGSAFVLGIGLGLCASPTLVAAQSTVGWAQRGVVTGTNMFSRSLGSAVGAAVFGAVANATLASRFAHPPAGVAEELPRNADATSLVLGGAPERADVAAYVRTSLQAATHHVFLGLAVLSVLGVGALLLMPRRVEAR
ncbi:EmrB/QacA subfamily drug resistance transporter [Amycolatopsis bartoniae]|uniref:MFS transporter n=1 Tax=Amycolatopsis bartoniae TaxID=941986 RepID=A0A8H9MD66_9PSEU|nr:MDR family MFS transporter [Amycolatopsis bartoniae]MBB2935597.1 EmrB/QacA subfamily drug resistance transporter [Amycolatopsis bartoniae]TVT05222.1 MFS transporter [Amycolatopsis bartoniae]GHF76897.1 MFS transporter [Amycolatopsis bartoniae]